MNRITKIVTILATAALVGCGGQPQPERQVSNAASPAPNAAVPDTVPVFSAVVSEYPSWSVFLVAAKAGLINQAEGGAPGPLEKKWNVDVVLKVQDYDPCITMYGGGKVDAVAITNIDVLNPALGRQSTAILPTSTSAGADKVIAIGSNDVANLKGRKTYGLEKSVSQYTFVRGLEKKGLNPGDYPFQQLDPAAAATAIQSSNGEIQSICVWNPFALQTLRTNRSAQVVFDSSLIPEEIIDMIVVSSDSLKLPGGERFACCLCDMYYEVNKRLNDPKTADATLKALGADFSNLPVEDMRICCKETRFYSTPDAGQGLFKSGNFRTTMGTVIKTSQSIGILTGNPPSIGYNDPNAQLNFDTRYMERVVQGR